MEDRNQIAQNVTKALMELNEELSLEQVIKDNKIYFELDNTNYRLRKPSFIEQEKLNKERNKKYLELVSSPDYLFREQWITKYKDKGIDIFDMEHKLIEKQTEIETLMLRLAQSNKPEDINTLKTQIQTLRGEQAELTIKKTDLMSYSIEDTLMLHINQYVSYLMLDKKVNDDWTKAFDTYELFLQSETKLINKAYYYMTRLIYETNDELPFVKKNS